MTAVRSREPRVVRVFREKRGLASIRLPLSNPTAVPALSRRVFLFRFTATIAALVLLTFAGFQLYVNATTAGFVYLLVILFSAARWGLAESGVASLLAVLGLNFFFLPRYRHSDHCRTVNW